MRNYLIWIMVAVLVVTQSVHAALYLDDIDNRDLSDSQNITSTNTTGNLPASQPLILDGDVDESQNTGTALSSLLLEDNDLEEEGTNPLSQLPELERDAEFLMSLKWLYEQGITKFQDPEQFMPDNYLSRVDSAKMLSILSRTVFGNTIGTGDGCTYTDIGNYDTITQWQVKDACQLGIFKSAPLFNPSQGITKGQLITVLIRMFDRKMLDETPTPWYKNYVQRAWEIWLLSDTSTAGMDEVVSRLDVAKLLYKLRNIHLNKRPINKENPLFINIVSTTATSGDTTYQALIDVDMIRNDSLETLEMKMDIVTYYFGKTKVYNYGATLSSFQVYGYIYASSESITPIGVGTWRVQQGIIQEWNLVIWWSPQTSYTIAPDASASFYHITKKE